jgi:hypothetical protein
MRSVFWEDGVTQKCLRGFKGKVLRCAVIKHKKEKLTGRLEIVEEGRRHRNTRGLGEARAEDATDPVPLS